MENLIADIEQDTANTTFLTGVKEIDKRVIDAFRALDRRQFVRPEDASQAYEDRPIDIGFGQTISQPFIVALITHLVEPKDTDVILEVGSGSGFQVALLAKLCRHVFGLEIIPELAKRSVHALQAAGILNATILSTDGTVGLAEHAPFNKIIVSAAANRLPYTLLDQLVVGGIMVLPKTMSSYDQMLIRVDKISDTEFKMSDILPVRFVPLVNS